MNLYAKHEYKTIGSVSYWYSVSVHFLLGIRRAMGAVYEGVETQPLYGHGTMMRNLGNMAIKSNGAYAFVLLGRSKGYGVPDSSRSFISSVGKDILRIRRETTARGRIRQLLSY